MALINSFVKKISTIFCEEKCNISKLIYCVIADCTHSFIYISCNWMCFVRDLIDVISMISVKLHLNCFELLIDLSVAFVIFENCQKIYIYIKQEGWILRLQFQPIKIILFNEIIYVI